jgi:transposase-like protein
MRFPKEVVETSVCLRHSGLILKETKKNVSKIYKIPVKACSTIWRWSQRFTKQTHEIIQGLNERLHCDETLLKTFQKLVFYYFWAIKCPKTKCIVGWHLSERRTLRDTKLLLWKARRRFPIDYLPKAIRTDSMPAYRFAISSVFSHEVKHEKVLSFKHGNNVIENFFRCKKRFPRFRTLESARKYIGHWVAEYNAEKMQILEMFIIRLCKAISWNHLR